MIEKRIYTPINYINRENTSPIIFLAGPIQGATNWQQEAIETIHAIKPDIQIANPRREYLPGEFDYNKQVDWEKYHLHHAGRYGAIMFWLARETEHDCTRAFAQTTRWEVSEWKKNHEFYGTKLVVGIEEGYTGARYTRRRFAQDCPDVPVFDSLEETAIRATVEASRPPVRPQSTRPVRW